MPRTTPWLLTAALLLVAADARAATWYRDQDGDGYGTSSTTESDTQPEGYAAQGGDCDDSDEDRNPGAVEFCDGVDNDCDGFEGINDPLSLPKWYLDGDGDGYGDPDSTPLQGCDEVAGRVPNGDDCDDTNLAISPDAVEACNDIDDDCDGTKDEEPEIAPFWFLDDDEDGWGTSESVRACEQPDGYAKFGGDCDDSSEIFHPRAFEACSPPLADTNCDGSIGDEDQDGDGTRACEDCDDQDNTVYPGATDQWYDGAIFDCRRESDFDQDFDGVDSADHGGTDCDDENPYAYPGADDPSGDDVDQDCDGADGTADTDVDSDSDITTVGGCPSCNSAGAGGGSVLAGLLVVSALVRRRR